jgi:hypothetical protein
MRLELLVGLADTATAPKVGRGTVALRMETRFASITSVLVRSPCERDAKAIARSFI